ncbi:hypothetical protein M3Y97_00017500 [Aphelenchoides bicaudatus]|nr:hypothetical protein M3Y97_00017500 [Aphelenchoides bicaudatus]
MDEKEEEQRSSSNESCDSKRLYLDNCVGILQEVPEYFDFGTLKVKLSSLNISPNFISLGSRCGALFLFNREYGRALKALRTTYNEVCTCQGWFCREEHNFLAIGHKSGTLILICLPSGKPGANRKLKQSIHENLHKEHEIVCIQWSPNGQVIYSGDVTGLILCVKADFNEEIYTTEFVYDGQEPIRFMQSTSNYLVACFTHSFTIFDISDSEENPNGSQHNVLVHAELPQRPIGLWSSNIELIFLLQDARLLRFSIGKSELEVICDLSESILKPQTLPEVIVGGVQREPSRTVWTMDDFANGSAHFYTSKLLLHSIDKLYLLEKLGEEKLGSFGQILLVDLRCQLKNSEDLTILESVYDEQTEEIFVLTSTQKLIRLAADPPPVDMIVYQNGKSSLLSSLSSAAQSSSKKWFQKFTAAGEFEQFQAPIQLPQNLSLAESSAVVGEYSQKLASNFTNLFENFKQQSFNNQPDSTQEVHESSDQEQSTHSSFSQTALDESTNEVVLEPTVQVKHRSRYRRMDKSTSSQTTEAQREQAAPESQETMPKEAETETVCVENLDKLLGVLGVGQFELLDTSNQQEQSTSFINDEMTQIGMTIEEPKIETKIEVDQESLHTPTDISDNETNDEGVLDDSESIQSIEHAINKQAIEDEVASTDRQQSLGTSNAEYSLVAKQANQRTDVWNRIQLPYKATWFDACANYMVICSNKRRERPQYRLFESVDNGILGGDWTQLKYPGSLVAVSDAGNLLWRVESGVAFAPCKLDPMSPFSTHWLEQANEGKVESVVLTSSTAWYLTTYGVCVQMKLPEMGIFYRAECPYQLNQITATDHAVWGLKADTGSLVVRVGIKHCPMGTDWVEGSIIGPHPLGKLWICNGVDENRPFGSGVWYQVCSPTNAVLTQHMKKFERIQNWRLKVCAAGVFINVGKFILSARQPLTAHSTHWVIPKRITLNDNFGLLSASGFVGETNDQIYVCQPNGEIYAFSTQNRNLTSLPSFDSRCSIVALSAAKDCLYVLDSCGILHVRDNLNSRLDSSWKKLASVELLLASTIISFAASSQSLWALTSDGCVWHSDLKSNPAETSWRFVDTPMNMARGEKLDQIRCSPSGKFVWVISSAAYRMWARCDVSEAGRSGLLWSETCNDVRMSELAVADNAVYGLAMENNQVYRLRSLSMANPAGLYWKPMPIYLRAISVDAFEQRLWGLDLDNKLVKHLMQIYPRNCLSDQHRPSRESASSVDHSISLDLPKAKLFHVHSDESHPTSTNEWFDVETEKHEIHHTVT